MSSKRITCFLKKSSVIKKHNESSFYKDKRSFFVQSCLNGYSSTKCQKSPIYLNYFKLKLVDRLTEDKKLIFASFKSKLLNKSTKKFNDYQKKGYFIKFKKTLIEHLQNFIDKIMFFLILFFILGFVFSSIAFNLNSLANPVNFNISNQNLDGLNSEKYSFDNNSNLFYDLTLTGNDVRDHFKKPIYFQFITNNRQSVKNVNHRFHHRPRTSTNYPNYLQRIMLNNDTVRCNDGTRAGYYFRKGKNSKKWIIFLEGGFFCYDMLTCHSRWLQMRNFMTSAHWPEKKLVNGILSSKRDENPHYHNANHVFLPYCSSDSWSGDLVSKNKGLHFCGSKIIENVIKDLVTKGLSDANLVYLAGSSAGATGVIINLDKIADLISLINNKTKVKGLIDSGWFLDNEPFKSLNSNNCLDGHLCSPIESIKKGFKFWNSQVPQSCINIYPDEPFKCFFGHRIYPTLRTPIFVIQYLFDEAQMTADNVAIPSTKSHWHYVYKMGLQTRNSLKNVTGLFAASCISHTMLIKKNWNQIRINGVSLSEAIRCWEIKQTSNFENKNLLKLNYQKKSNAVKNEVDIIGPNFSPSLHSNNYYFPSNVHSNVFNFRETNSIFDKLFDNSRKRKVNRKLKKNRFNVPLNDNSFCPSVRFIDECTFPLCNQQCPKLKNIITGKDINFFDLLKVFGVKWIN